MMIFNLSRFCEIWMVSYNPQPAPGTHPRVRIRHSRDRTTEEKTNRWKHLKFDKENNAFLTGSVKSEWSATTPSQPQAHTPGSAYGTPGLGQHTPGHTPVHTTPGHTPSSLTPAHPGIVTVIIKSQSPASARLSAHTLLITDKQTKPSDR